MESKQEHVYICQIVWLRQVCSAVQNQDLTVIGDYCLGMYLTFYPSIQSFLFSPSKA